MKKYYLVVLIAGLIISGLSPQVYSKEKKEKKEKKERKVSKASLEKAAKYQKEAEKYQAAAKKAEEAGQQDLAALYNECAQCQMTIAGRYEGKVDRDEAKKAFSKYKETGKKIEKLLREQKKDKKKDPAKSSKDSSSNDEKAVKKKTTSEERAAGYQKQAEDLKKMADQLRAKGNKEDAVYYDKLAAAKTKISEAYKSKDMKAVQAAKEEYYKLKETQK